MTHGKEMNCMGARKSVRDFNGKEFDSIKDMCEHWGIKRMTYMARIKRGWSLEDALTKSITDNEDGSKSDVGTSGKVCFDHKGNAYSSIKEMCEAYGITYSVYLERMRRYSDTEKALTLETCSFKPIFVNGKEYSKISEIAKDARISIDRAKNLISEGVSCEDILNNKFVHDHLGNGFRNSQQMCNYWGIKYSTYRMRILNNFTLEEALTNPVDKGRGRHGVVDADGRWFKSQDTMCKAWDVTMADVRKEKEKENEELGIILKRIGKYDEAKDDDIDERERRKQKISIGIDE